MGLELRRVRHHHDADTGRPQHPRLRRCCRAGHVLALLRYGLTTTHSVDWSLPWPYYVYYYSLYYVSFLVQEILLDST